VALQTFSHLGICVRDLDLSTRFYENVLGFKHLFSVDLGPELEATMETPGCRFTSRMLAREDIRIELLGWTEPAATGAGERRAMTAAGLTHLCFRVESADDLADLAGANGGEFHRQTLTELSGMGEGGGAIVTVHLTDPDGTRIECIAGQPDLADAAAQLFR
jgi:glyoxylase I family protein